MVAFIVLIYACREVVVPYEVDGVDVTGTISIKSTSGWGDYQYNTTSPKDLRLTAGRHKIKVVFGNAAFNIRSMRFTYVDDL